MGVVLAFLADFLGFVAGVLRDPAVWIIALVVTVFTRHYIWVFIAGAFYSLGLLALDLSMGLGRPVHIVIGQFLVICGLCLFLWPLRRLAFGGLRRATQSSNNATTQSSDVAQRQMLPPRRLWKGAIRVCLAASVCWLVLVAAGLTFVWVEEDRSPFVASQLDGFEPCRLRPLTAEERANFEAVQRGSLDGPGFVAPAADIERARRCMDWNRYQSIQTRFLTGLTLQVLGPPLVLALLLLLTRWVVGGFRRSA